jgi:DNA replication protein DnaC
VLTEIEAPSTKERRIFTPNPGQVFEFDTCNEPQLKDMLDAVNEFVADWFDEDTRPAEPYWLTLLGPSGIGKSHLARQLSDLARTLPIREHPTLTSGVRFEFWPSTLEKLRDGKYFLIKELTDCNILFLDDPAAERDPTGFAADVLYRILEGRRNKWTMITSNATPEEIAARLDTRIMSRLGRGRNKVRIADVLDYGLRPGRREFFRQYLLHGEEGRKCPILERFGWAMVLNDLDDRWMVFRNGKLQPLPDELWVQLRGNSG